jgi:hypothetical protein
LQNDLPIWNSKSTTYRYDAAFEMLFSHIIEVDRELIAMREDEASITMLKQMMANWQELFIGLIEA